MLREFICSCDADHIAKGDVSIRSAGQRRVGTAHARDLWLVWGQGNNGSVGHFMKPRLATIVVESRLLVREALKSLMAKHSYRVVCDVGSAAAISAAAISEEPKLVILGAQSADKAVAEAVAIRKLWPDSKIILLYEDASLADFQKLLPSEINGCVPLFASSDTLIRTLDMIMIRDVRIMVTPDAECPVMQPAQPEKSYLSGIKLQSDGAEHEDVSVSVGALQHAPLPATLHHRLSEREIQILDGLVKGHANKVIGRACDIAEATVKIHMKSILRKIGVGNRTQAAMWALANGYAAEGFNGRLLKPAEAARNAASITEAAIRSVATIVDHSRNTEEELPALAPTGAVEPVGAGDTAKALKRIRESNF